MAKNNQTPEQREAREKQAKVARANLCNDYITRLAAAELGTPEQYGQLMKGMYEQTVSNVPDEQTYNQLFLPALLNGNQGMVVNEAYLKSTANRIVQESLLTLPADEALKIIGVSNSVAGKYAGKSVDELSDEEKSAIIGTYLPNMVESVIEKSLPEMRKARASTLEKILTQKA